MDKTEQAKMLKSVKSKIKNLKNQKKKFQNIIMKEKDIQTRNKYKRDLCETTWSLEDWNKFLKKISK